MPQTIQAEDGKNVNHKLMSKRIVLSHTLRLRIGSARTPRWTFYLHFQLRIVAAAALCSMNGEEIFPINFLLRFLCACNIQRYAERRFRLFID